MSVGSAAALVAGTTVGAGVLALPAATRGAGFVASSGVLVASWAFMAVAALLVAETSVGVVCATGRVDLGFLATVRSLCGPRVGSVAGAAYAFIHYALLVAYAAQGGALLAGAVGADPALGAVAFSGVLGGTVAFGSGDVVDAVNNAFVVVVVASFAALLCLGSGEFDAGRLLATSGDAGAAFGAVPISILALVYHNVVPLVATRLKGDRPKIAAAILAGSAVPLVMFLLWNGLILGSVDGDAVAAAGGDPVAALVAAEGGAAASALGPTVALFSLSAVVTSFVGFYFGLRTYLRDLFLGDGGGGPLADAAESEVLLAALVLAPPTLVACVDPKIFLPALDAAGTFGITTLFGIIPAVAAYRQREGAADGEVYVPGGAATLGAMVAISAAVLGEGVLDGVGVL